MGLMGGQGACFKYKKQEILPERGEVVFATKF